MSRIVCPRCGFTQDDGVECRRCQVIFERYHGPTPSLPSSAATARPPSPGRRLFRWVWWSMLGLGILTLGLVFWGSTVPGGPVDPVALQRAELKVLEHQRLSGTSRPHRLELDQPELNSWLGGHLALAPPRGAEVPSEDSEAIERAQSTVRDVKIELLEDSLRAHVVFDLYGVDVTLLLEGRLFARDGYVRFEPSRGKLGMLPLPESSIRSAMQRLFDSPENREKFRLPPDVKEIGVRGGRLYLVSG
ncbi:MAG: hypothetical protein ABIG68_09845 [Acidobacteriota bacterium]